MITAKREPLFKFTGIRDGLAVFRHPAMYEAYSIGPFTRWRAVEESVFTRASLEARIANLEREGYDTSEERIALEALDAATESEKP